MTPARRPRHARLALLGAGAIVLALVGVGPAMSLPGEGVPAGSDSGVLRPGSHAQLPAALGDAPNLVPARVVGPGMSGKSPASPAARASALGAHTAYVMPVYWSGSEPAAVSEAAVSSAVSSANSYLTTATGGKVSIALGWVTDWRRITLSAAEAARCDLPAIAREVRAQVGAGGDHDHLIVHVNNSACAWTDLESLGLSSYGDGYNISNNFLVPDIFLRAVGHNQGVSPSGSLVCSSAGVLVPLSSTCSSQPYTNPWDFLSDHPYGKVGSPIADTLAGLGVLTSSSYVQASVGATQTVTLSPLSATSGVRGVWFELGGYRYLIDYRIPAGLDTWIDDATFTSALGARTDPGGGVALHRQKLGSPTASRDVVDLHASGPVVGADTNRHPGLEAGEVFRSPDGSFALRVVAASTTSAQVELSYPTLGKVTRWSGPDRFATSAQISKASYPAGVPVAYIASGRVYPDALSAAPVAGMRHGPILLVDTDAIPAVIAEELRRLAPQEIVVLGGTATLTAAVETAADAFTTGPVRRWSGADRYEASATISRNSYPAAVDTVYLASGQVFTDALSGAPVAGKSSGPILLVRSDSVPSSIQLELRRLAPRRIVLLGGPSTITPAVEASLKSSADSVVRWAGPDRFSTSTAITLENYVGPGGTVYIASGRVYTDALSGAPVAGSTGAPVLLVDTTSLPEVTRAEIIRLKPSKIVILGGPATVSYDVQAALAALLP